MQLNQEIVIGKSVKRVGLQRYLVTKIALQSERIELRDLYALYANQLWLQEKCLRDKAFREKFGTSLEVVARSLSELPITEGLSLRTFSRMAKRVSKEIPDFLFPLRNYSTMKTKFSGLYTLKTLKSLGQEVKRLPPKAYIGKGYGDKGTAKKPELDASPSWQDVASVVSEKERLLDEVTQQIRNAKSGREAVRLTCKHRQIRQEIEQAIKSRRGQ